MNLQKYKYLLMYLVFILLYSRCFAQELNADDFRFGLIHEGSTISEIVNLIGTPLKIEFNSVPKTGGEFFVNTAWVYLAPDTEAYYYFDSLFVKFSSLGFAGYIEISMKSFSTFRGISVGDSVEKVKELYGTPGKSDWHPVKTEFDEMIMPYFENNSMHGITFVIKNGKVIKIVIGWGVC